MLRDAAEYDEGGRVWCALVSRRVSDVVEDILH